MRTRLREIAEFMDPVQTPVTLAELLAVHRFHDGEAPSYRVIWDRHNGEHCDVKTLFLNTYLMNITSDWLHFLAQTIGIRSLFSILSPVLGMSMSILLRLGVPVVFSLVIDKLKAFWEKPFADERAVELGELLRDKEFELVALAEVFEANILEKVLAAWETTVPPNVASAIKESTFNSSGLATLCTIFEPVEVEFERYEDAGFPDNLADKGVLRVAFNVGMGDSLLQVYSTHLQAGHQDKKLKQLEQLTAFVARTLGNHPAIIVGDFNIDAYRVDLSQPDYHDTLVRAMQSIGFEDTWTRNGSAGYTHDMHDPEVAGIICPIAGAGEFMNYCNDNQELPDFDLITGKRELPANRIDYIFINQPEPEHSFRIDFTRPFRLRMERATDAPGKDKIAFLSDHVGLTFNMVISRS